MRTKSKFVTTVLNTETECDLTFGNCTMLAIYFGAGCPAGTYQLTSGAPVAKHFTSADAELEIVLGAPGPRTIICDGNLAGLGCLGGCHVVFPSAATEDTTIVVNGV